MKLPVITRHEYEARIAVLEARIKDLERHFVTKRDETGKVIETLADVPIEKRSPTRTLRGLSWPQRRALLEATDGFRRSS